MGETCDNFGFSLNKRFSVIGLSRRFRFPLTSIKRYCTVFYQIGPTCLPFNRVTSLDNNGKRTSVDREGHRGSLRKYVMTVNFEEKSFGMISEELQKEMQ